MKKPHLTLITLNCNEVTCGRCQGGMPDGYCWIYKDYAKLDRKGKFERLVKCQADEFAADLMTAIAAKKVDKPIPTKKTAGTVAANLRKETSRPCPNASHPARPARTTTPSKRSRSTTRKRAT